MKDQQKKPLRGDIKRKSILQAARKLFLNQGFSATSMDAVADEAGVSKRTVYDHFGTKKELFEAMLSIHWDTLSIPNNKLFVEQQSIAVNLKYFAEAFLKFLYHKDTIDLFRLLISETNQFPDLASNILINEKGPFTRVLIEFLQQKKVSGELTIEDADRSAAYFLGLLKEYHFWPMMLGFTKQKKLSQRNKLIDEAVAIFLQAYLKK
jgi:AcrR family transcriptional regulator